MKSENFNKGSDQANVIDDALSILDSIDDHRNLSGGVTSILFFACAGFSVRAFFWIVDFTTWLGFGKIDPVFPSAVSFISVFVVWIFSFLAVSSALGAMGFRDVQAVTKLRLSKLTFEIEELRELSNIVAHRSWRNGGIFERLVADLIKAQSDP